MMKRLFLLIIPFLCASCATGNRLSNAGYEEPAATETRVLIPNGDLVHSRTVVEGEVEYTVAVQDGKIVFLSTTDEDFTVGGLRVNDPLPASYADKEWGFRLGWGYYKEIESGWYAGFDPRKKPAEDAPIQWFFKYKFTD